MEHHTTAPYSPQQNGVVERRNQSIVAMTRCMLKSKNLSAYFWGVAVVTAVYILNRSATRALDGITPYEAWHGASPAVHYFCTFGYIAHVKFTWPGLKKQDDMSLKTIFVGYEAGSKACRCYDPIGRRVIISRDVVLDEGVQWDWKNDEGESAADFEQFVVEYSMEITTVLALAGGSSSPAAAAGPTTPKGTPVFVPAPEFVSPPPLAEEDLNIDHDDAPLRFRTVDAVISDAAAPGLARRVLQGEINFTSAEEPASFNEAKQDACWRAAMIKEMKAIERYKTWELTTLPPGHRAIELKWVFKEKKNQNGDVVRHKARLVAKGYAQRAGVGFDEVFAPVVRLEFVRMMVAMAAHLGWEVHHMDVKSTFLNGELTEEVYVQQPPGFIIAGSEQKVLRLHKALYRTLPSAQSLEHQIGCHHGVTWVSAKQI